MRVIEMTRENTCSEALLAAPDLGHMLRRRLRWRTRRRTPRSNRSTCHAWFAILSVSGDPTQLQRHLSAGRKPGPHCLGSVCEVFCRTNCPTAGRQDIRTMGIGMEGLGGRIFKRKPFCCLVRPGVRVLGEHSSAPVVFEGRITWKVRTWKVNNSRSGGWLRGWSGSGGRSGGWSGGRSGRWSA